MATNHQYWDDKINRNMERDNEVNQQLRAAGWTVLRFWDIDINKSLDECINTIIEAVLESKVSKEY